MSEALIIAAEKIVDGVGSQQYTLSLEEKISQLDFPLHKLIIEPLNADWHSPEKENNFRSGCAPIEALQRACELIRQGEHAVVIQGEDNIKTGYTRDERLSLMAVYGERYPLTDAYTELADTFVTQHGGDADLFKRLAADLFENYKLSYRDALGSDFAASMLPDERWYKYITPLFRGVDCANPLIDFSGRMLICSEYLCEQLAIDQKLVIKVKGVGTERLEGDGRDYIKPIASYEHLESAFRDCAEQSTVDFVKEFHAGNVLLEAYTCYPVVPMAFLLASGLVAQLEDIPAFLKLHRITQTGGMNLARGPWNNPAFNGLISMYKSLLSGTESYGLVHGNGGLGYRQGVALLER